MKPPILPSLHSGQLISIISNSAIERNRADDVIYKFIIILLTMSVILAFIFGILVLFGILH
jgi:hypothetical protein